MFDIVVPLSLLYLYKSENCRVTLSISNAKQAREMQ